MMLQHGHVNMQKNQLILTLGQSNQQVLKRLKKVINNRKNILIVQKHLKINNDNLYHSSNNS